MEGRKEGRRKEGVKIAVDSMAQCTNETRQNCLLRTVSQAKARWTVPL